MPVARILLPLPDNRPSRNTPKPKPGICKCVNCIAIQMNFPKEKPKPKMKKAISETQRMAGSFSNDPAQMLDMPSRGGDGDTIEPVGDDDFDGNGSPLVSEAQDHMDAAGDDDCTSDEAAEHITKARDCLTKHLQSIGAEAEPPVRTQFTTESHCVAFPPNAKIRKVF